MLGKTECCIDLLNMKFTTFIVCLFNCQDESYILITKAKFLPRNCACAFGLGGKVQKTKKLLWGAKKVGRRSVADETPLVGGPQQEIGRVRPPQPQHR